MLKKLTETIKTIQGTENNEYWLTKESCNKLIEEAESIRVTEGGIFELKFNSGDAIGIKTEGILLYGESETAYVKVVYLNSEFETDATATDCVVL